MSAVLMLVLARARRRPGRWLVPGLGLALAVAFAGAVWVQTQVTATQAARNSLAGLGPLDRAVRISWEGPVTATARAQALGALRTLQLAPATEVTLLNPVRLSGVIVRPAAITPLGRWSFAAPISACAPQRCPVLAAGAGLGVSSLSTPGARLVVAGQARLESAVPLGFVPESDAAQWPVLVTGDVRGLDTLPGLSGVYRSHSWVALMSTGSLASWELPALAQRLARVQASLAADSPQFTVAAPFAAVGSARAAADAVPRRLLLAGGGAVAALALFIVLSAGGLRRDLQRERDRLEIAGARRGHQRLFVAAEAAWLSALGAACGVALALAAGAVLAASAHVPAAGALSHSLLTPAGAIAVAGGWLLGAALLSAIVLVRGRGAANAVALAAGAALVAAVAVGGRDNGSLALLLAPLGCLAAGVLVYRAAGRLAAVGERLARRAPVLVRLALVGLARAPEAPAMAIAFVALTTGLGGFALLYRATLARSASDQTSQQVPLDAIVAASPGFTRPLSVVGLARWRALAGGAVLPVRRTEASYVNGAGSVTVPALGIPAAELSSLHDWGATRARASAALMGRALVNPGPVRNPGPVLPTATRWLSLGVSSSSLDVSVTAELRSPDGTVTGLGLGVAGAHTRALRARVPLGRWEVAAIELSEPTGLQITNDHQNGENAGAATQRSVLVGLGPLRALAATGATLVRTPIGAWTAVGAARVHRRGSASIRITFAQSGLTAVLRPVQPSDWRPVPVLVDPGTAAAAARGGRFGLEVDGVPVAARVVGVSVRFPTVSADSAGFVVADEATLASALDAQMPGQGAPDELWLATTRLRSLRSALAGGPLGALRTTFAVDVQRGLRHGPLAEAVMGTLTGAAALAGALAVLGLLVALIGGLRDRELQDDLLALGLGPRALRTEARLRLGFAAALGVGCGLLVALGLARLGVAVVRAAGAVAAPDPPLAAVTPVWLLLGWALAAFSALVLAGWAATGLTHRGRA